MTADPYPDQPDQSVLYHVEAVPSPALDASSPRVLVVEDDPALAALLVEVMRWDGYDATTCGSGEAGWIRVQGQPFPLVVLDWLLPGRVDGLELCRRLRRLPGGDLAYVIVLTGRTGADDLEAVLDAGADDYLAKPFDLDAFRVRLTIAARHVQARAERAAIEAALQRSEARFRSLVQHASDLITVVDDAGIVRYDSPGVGRILGYDPETTLGTPHLPRVHPDDAVRAVQAFEELRAHPGEHRAVELRFRHRDGTFRHLELTVTNLLQNPDVGGIVVNGRDITERRAIEVQLAHQALHDPLTGLPNRALFRDRVDRALLGAARRGEGDGVLVLTLDLDLFKEVIESVGHAAGDRLLVAVAGRLAAAVPPSDTVARLGGDEFGILREGPAAPAEARRFGEEALAGLAEPFALDGRELIVTASAGVAFRPAGAAGDATEALLREADIAVFRAKAAGRATPVVYDAKLHPAAADRMDLERDLRRALARGELRLHYQPELDLASGAVVGVEALLRWAHPRRGLVAPAAFVPLAEEKGLIVPIGRWVLHEACRQASAWQATFASGQRPFAVNVNLAARQLHQPDFVEGVAVVLQETGLPPQALVLEITERSLVEDIAVVTAALDGLRALGVRLALDDFGTGYSSFSYLPRLALDAMKIDRAFVGGADRDERGDSIVRALCAVAHALNMDVTAEGIETPEQLASVRAAGCDRGQGFLFARPMPPEDLAAFLGAAV
jgi:diguanylate cyclase (GGDEF)-like protein/PAS domain S-box-containing protein